MSWFRLDDRGAFHAKVVGAGNEAYGAWCRAGQWSCAYGTSGVLPRHMAMAIAPDPVWERLITVRLLEAHEDGYLIHDFLEYNPTPEQVAEKRLKRSEAGQRGGLRSAESRRIQATSKQTKQNSSKPEANIQANPKQTRSIGEGVACRVPQSPEPGHVTERVETSELGAVSPIDPSESKQTKQTASKPEANAQASAQANSKQNSTPIPIPIPISEQTPKPPSGAPCVLVSDNQESAPALVPTRDHEPAEWRAGQTTDDGLFGMLEAEYARGLRDGIGRPVTGCAGRRDVQALRAVCQAHALGADSAPLRSQALLTWVFAAAQEFGSTMPGTLTPTIVAFKGWLDRGRKHFDSGPKRHPAEANAPAQPRAFPKDPPRPSPTGNASGILDLIEAGDADCGAAAGPRSDVRGRGAPDIDPDEIGASRGNVDGISKRAGEAR